MRHMRSFKEIISTLYEVAGVNTDVGLAKFLGVSPQSVAQARSTGKIPNTWLIKVCEMTNYSLDKLVFGDRFATDHSPEMILIPLVSARVSAGGGSLETDNDILDFYAFRKDWLDTKGHHKDMVLMRVSGDSMEPALHSGDIVLADQSKKDIIPHQIYVIGVGEGIYVKELVTLPQRTLRLKSINPQYENMDFNLSEDDNSVRIIGRVIWWCHDVSSC